MKIIFLSKLRPFSRNFLKEVFGYYWVWEEGFFLLALAPLIFHLFFAKIFLGVFFCRFCTLYLEQQQQQQIEPLHFNVMNQQGVESAKMFVFLGWQVVSTL
eukprot:TRINITY_DN692_c1_g2_i1.p6 TRINITY_DN692_c1_g2~~TRINITY_DN692_c1_g2_i1.p6  ORF type:complete len:101 (-),score=9.62 TRINITY_DN692_c1_g2_i1:492-794(-)